MDRQHVLVISDNERILSMVAKLLRCRPELLRRCSFSFACSVGRGELAGRSFDGFKVETINLKQQQEEIVREFDLVISAHCRQLFPPALVRRRRCINIHPGFNPYNRGWFPHVFSIVNGLPLGATIHEMDEQIDHGAIIDQIEVSAYPWDTSLEAYDRVVAAEQKLLERSFDIILRGEYQPRAPISEGNLNRKRDFEALCAIGLDETVTFQQAIDRLRALTHGSIRNAYFVDPKTGRKVYVRLTLEPEDAEVEGDGPGTSG